MKTAYELALERLNKTSPPVKLNDAQKKALAELDSRYTAKIAERELALQAQISQAAAGGEFERMEQLQRQLISEREKMQAELEAKKEAVRAGRAGQ
jgi:hypothetical protein